MAWTGSSIFRIILLNILDNAIPNDYGATGDAWKVALYNNTPVPDNDVVLASAVYAVDQWVVTSELSDAAEWPVAGQTLAGQALSTPVADVVMWDGNDTASGVSATLAGVQGCLVYDNTGATKYAASYHWFGGAQSVTDGTFTVVWHANGINRWTMAQA